MRLIISCLPVLFMLASCGRPISDELFSFFDDAGYAEYSLDMSDSTAYSLQLYVYADDMLAPGDSLTVRMDYLSPDNVPYSETLVLYGVNVSDRALCRTLREDFRPVTYGLWRAAVNIGHQNKEKYNITGAGLRLIRGNGTR